MQKSVQFLPFLTIILIASISIYAQEIYKTSEYGRIDFVLESFLDKEDKVCFYNINNGQEEKSLIEVNTIYPNVAYQNEDTIKFELFSEHRLKVQIIGNQFKCEVSELGCTNHSQFKMKEQSLKIVKSNDKRPLRIQGSIFYEGVKIRSHQYQLADKVRIKGYFDLNLLSSNE